MNIFFNKITLFLIGIILIPLLSFTQEFTLKETPEEKEKKEEKRYLEFQEHFFEALHQKSREDYTKAIESLDLCKAIYPDDAGLNFEYAKNYLKLKDYDNAVFFDDKALLIKPNNLYILEHLKESYRLQHDYINAITIQKKMVAIKPSKENGLVYLYINNRQKDKAKESFLRLKKLGLLDMRERYFTRILFPEKNKITTNNIESPKSSNDNIASEKEDFLKNKNYKSLIKLLEKEDHLNQFENLLKDSEEGLSLFPAQPSLYLLHSKALNVLKNHKKAISTLETGLDFIIDDNILLIAYFEQMKIAYLGLGQPTNATKYANKALALRELN